MDRKDFGDWDSYYKDNDVKSMPWYNAELDSSLAHYLVQETPSVGRCAH